MSFIVETGEGLSTATSYIDLEFANTYADSFFSEKDYATWQAASDNTLERLLNRATIYLDRTYEFFGERTLSTQALEFPRADLYDNLGYVALGVPIVIKQATCMAAMKLLNKVDLSPDVGRKTIREKIDVIENTFAEGSSLYSRFTEIENLLISSGFIQRNRNRSSRIRLIQG